MSHAEFLAVSTGVIHWGAAAAAKESVSVPGVSTQGQSCGTVEVKGVTQQGIFLLCQKHFKAPEGCTQLQM